MSGHICDKYLDCIQWGFGPILNMVYAGGKGLSYPNLRTTADSFQSKYFGVRTGMQHTHDIQCLGLSNLSCHLWVHPSRFDSYVVATFNDALIIKDNVLNNIVAYHFCHIRFGPP